jgi:Coenzyme PQQ synthesis protein D (PqqD)
MLEKQIKRNFQVIWDIVDGAMVLCNTDCAEFFELNSTGAIVWKICDGCTTNDIVQHLQEVYPDEDHQQLASDVKKLISSFNEAGLLEFRIN